MNDMNQKKPRVAIAFNLCNSGWTIQQAFLSVGIDADLYISSSELNTPSDPRWNDPEIFARGKRCFFWNFDKKACSDFSLMPEEQNFNFSSSRYLNLLRFVFFLRKNYDFVVGTALGILPAYLSGKPCIWHATGSDLRQWINLRNRPSSFLLKKAARSALSIVTAQNDREALESVEKNGLSSQILRLPMMVPHVTTGSFLVKKKNDVLSIFAPASHIWKDLPEGHPGKGNDIFLKGLALLREKRDDFLVTLLRRGKDVTESQKLVKALGVQQNVVWGEEMDRPTLHKTMAYSDVVVDQFSIGCAGTICPEGMLLGKPVLIYLSNWFDEYHVPVLNCKTEQDVCDALMRCWDPVFREKLGERGRLWIREHASCEALGDKLRKIIYSDWHE